MGVLLVPLIAILVVAAVAWFLLRTWGRDRHETSDRLAGPQEPTLDYQVPAGQDPAAVTLALSQDGYLATTDPLDTQLVHVACPTGRDRERARVRAVIASVHTTGIDAGAPFEPGDVRFRDED